MTQRLKFIGVPAGMGSTIIQTSFLLAVDQASEVFVSSEDNLSCHIKRIWQIPDEKLSVTVGQDPEAKAWLESDELCTYVPYLYNDHLNLFGRNIPIKKSRKKSVAVCMHHGGGLREDITVRSMPYCKYGTREEYEMLFTLLDRSGYDVITMNHPAMDIEHKTYILNELCDAVIGYEGGLHHLAHVLKIPSIILPWKFCDNGDPGMTPGIWLESQRYHADRRTWFVMGDPKEELLSWTPKQLQDKIDGLYQEQGNNVLFSPDVEFDPATLKLYHRSMGMDLTPRLCWCETRGEKTVKFIKDNLPLENMVRYPLKPK